MVMVYLLAVIGVMVMNASQVLPSLKLIITEAWNFKTLVTGGFWGLVIIGVKQSKNDEPIREGLVASLGPFIDTILVCTLTAIVIILSGAYLEEGSGIVMTLNAFNTSLGSWGGILLLQLVFCHNDCFCSCSILGTGEKFNRFILRFNGNPKYDSNTFVSS